MKEFDKKSSPGREGFSKFLPASMSDSSTRRRLTEYEIQVQDLQAYVRSLEAETVHLRKKLEDTPKDFMVLENKLREANRQLVQAFNQNEKLVNALYEAREQITALKEEVDKLCAPPSTYGVYLSLNEDATVNILAQGRKVKVNLHPSIKPETIKPGQELVLNEGLNVVEAAGGSTAVEILRARPDRFSAVLLDLVMPGMTGSETFRALTAIRPDLPVVVCTGYAADSHIDTDVKRRIAGLVQKPFTPERLSRALLAAGAQPTRASRL